MIAGASEGAVATVGLAVLISCIAWIAIRLCRLLDVHTRAERTRGALLCLDHAVTSVVRELQQVAVGSLKSGVRGRKLGNRIPAILQRAAHARIKQYLGSRGASAVAVALSLDPTTVDQLITTRIEAAVHELKQYQRTASSRKRSAPRTDP